MLFRHLYSLIYALLLPLFVLRLLWRSLKAPAYRQRIIERFAFFTSPDLKAADTNRASIWLHAVSVGETLAAVPLVRALQKQYPQYKLVITTTTPTGSERVRALFGGSVFHVYTPYDLPIIVNRFIGKTQPAIAIIMETELWPNMLACCQQHNIPTVIANARLSEKSAKGYQQLSLLSRNMLQNISCIAAQNTTDGQRFIELGLPEDNLKILGSIKFDLDIDVPTQEKAKRLREEWSPNKSRLIWLAASTHPGEDEIILEVFRRLKLKLDNVLLVLVPRHPERFDEVYELCKSHKLNIARHSQQQVVESFTDVVLGDTMGELLAFYGACDMAFVGGSLVPVGGHNVIEPAAWGKAIVCGSHLHNFNEISQQLISQQGMVSCENENELYHCVKNWCIDNSARQASGQTAQAFAEQNKGALKKLLQLIQNQLSIVD